MNETESKFAPTIDRLRNKICRVPAVVWRMMAVTVLLLTACGPGDDYDKQTIIIENLRNSYVTPTPWKGTPIPDNGTFIRSLTATAASEEQSQP